MHYNRWGGKSRNYGRGNHYFSPAKKYAHSLSLLPISLIKKDETIQYLLCLTALGFSKAYKLQTKNKAR